MFTLRPIPHGRSTRPSTLASARICIGCGLATAAVGTAGLVEGLEPFRTYFYAFVWWGWIAVASGWTRLLGRPAILLDRFRGFVALTVWSVPFWLAFELINVVLRNWYYVGAMPTRPERMLGMVVCFATVLPGVLATRDWLDALGLFRNLRCRPWPVNRSFALACTIAGVLFLALPLWKPERFYPLVWGSTVLLGEAWLVRRGRRGLLTTLAEGDPRPALQLLVAGFVTGGLWESWNYHAGAKWIYTVPGFEELKLFEMPVLGFFGFPPFALECWSFACVLAATGLAPSFEFDRDTENESDPNPETRSSTSGTETPGPQRLPLAGLVVALVISAPMMWLTDERTVRETRPLVSELEQADAQLIAELGRLGIEDVAALRRHLVLGRPSPVDAFGPHQRRALFDEIELLSTAGLGVRGRAWLAAADVHDVEALSELDWTVVCELDPVAGYGPAPYDREVRYWIRSAKKRIERGELLTAD